MNISKPVAERRKSMRQRFKTNLPGIEVIEYGDEVPLSILRYFFPYLDKSVRKLAPKQPATN